MCVIGLGLNGIVSAIACKQAGFEVQVFESGKLDGYKDDRRTSVLTFETVEFFKMLGLYEKIKDHIAPIFHIYSFEESQKFVLSFDSGVVSENPFGFVIHNSSLKKALISALNELSIKIIPNKIESVIAKESFAKVILDTKAELDFKLILNCKGKNQVQEDNRKVFPYKQDAFVFNIKHEKEHKNIAVESFTASGPLAILPLISQNESSIIWTVTTNSSAFLKTLPQQEFLNIFAQKVGRMGHIGKVLEITDEIKSYPLSLSFLSSQIQDRTMLIGDIFNTIHPVAGSGFNMSVKDIKNLYHSLIECKRLGLDIGSFTVLSQISRKNLKTHIEMNLFTHFLVKIFSNSNNFLRLARQFGLKTVEEISILKRFFMKKASGIA